MVAMEPVVTIDGPSGAGKSSVARVLAKRGGWRYLNTGSLYRALTLGLLSRGLDQVSDQRAEWICANVAAIQVGADLSAHDPKTFCNDAEVDHEIRGEAVTRNVSEVSALPCVRSELLLLQRELIALGGIVVEGRDIGSVVWPEAGVKFYLTADLKARAQRRHAEGSAEIDIDSVEGAIAQRDQVDSTRSHSPLTIPEGAMVVDTTELTLEQVVECIWNEIERKLRS
jgi:cytidylate kinase